LARRAFCLRFARDGLLPKSLGRVQHAATRRTCNRMLRGHRNCPGADRDFTELAVLSALTTARFISSAAPRPGGSSEVASHRAAEPLNFHWLGIATLLGITSMVALVRLPHAKKSRTVVFMAVSVAVYLLQTKIRRSAQR